MSHASRRLKACSTKNNLVEPRARGPSLSLPRWLALMCLFHIHRLHYLVMH